MEGDEDCGFCSAELLRVGGYLITLAYGQLDEERIDELERRDKIVRTVAIRVPGTNTYLAEGVRTHNDAKGSSSGAGTLLAPTSSRSGPGFSNSGGSSGDSGLTILTTGSSSSSSSSGSKSSGSSFSSSSSIGVSNTGATNTD